MDEPAHGLNGSMETGAAGEDRVKLEQQEKEKRVWEVLEAEMESI